MHHALFQTLARGVLLLVFAFASAAEADEPLDSRELNLKLLDCSACGR